MSIDGSIYFSFFEAKDEFNAEYLKFDFSVIHIILFGMSNYGAIYCYFSQKECFLFLFINENWFSVFIIFYKSSTMNIYQLILIFKNEFKIFNLGEEFIIVIVLFECYSIFYFLLETFSCIL